jgi:hypothetical protein
MFRIASYGDYSRSPYVNGLMPPCYQRSAQKYLFAIGRWIKYEEIKLIYVKAEDGAPG